MPKPQAPRSTTAQWAKIKQEARRMRKAPTPAEQVLWHHLRGHQVAGLKFRRQHTIGQYIVDFFCAECQLAVEVDGGLHAQQREADAIRQTYLESQGVTVLRFDNAAVLNETNRVIAEIAQACAKLRRGKVEA